LQGNTIKQQQMNELTKILIRILPFLIIIIALTIRVNKGKLSKDDLGIRKPETNLNALIWCFSFLMFCILTEFILFQVELLEFINYEFDIKTSVLKIIGMVLIAPIAEELLYRGLFLTKLIKLKINKHVAIFIIAILFVIVHSFVFENTMASKIGIIQIFVDATLFGYARLTTKSILTPIVMHITGNLIATIEMYLL
jgi:membrane protease YdiL (CAAX protease family)